MATIQEVAELLNGGGQAAPIPMTAGGYQAGVQNFQNSPAYTLYNGTNATSTDPLVNFRNSAASRLFNGTTPSTGDPLSDFRNSGEYRLAFGPNATSNDPSTNFQNDPGVQMAIKQGLIPLMGSHAAKGLGESGALSKALSDYMYNHYFDYVDRQRGMYNNYQGINSGLLNNQQTVNSNLFNNYQNQLAGLSQLGSQNTGSQNAFAMGTNLGNLFAGANLQTGQNLANAYLGTGQNLAQANLSTGQDIASLFGNQGILNASAILNTGAAQANNLFQGMNLLAQLNANQQASNAQSQNSLLRGQGASAAMGGIF